MLRGVGDRLLASVGGAGKYAMENLPAGEYRLGVRHFESRKNAKGRPWMASQTRRLVLEPGQRPAAVFAF